jgi:hypothetical protein
MDPAMMKHSLAIAALALAAACATQPKPCTAEWVDWKTERFFDEFARDHRKDINELRDVTSSLDPSGQRGAADIASLALAGVRALGLAGDFLSDTVPEINSALSQCGTTPKATQLFASLLRREGFDDRAVKAVEDLGLALDRES